jgi:organic radical activating enzyme
MTAAPLYEVFSSIQGEATHVGELHLFVRLAGCDLECRFCDTPASRKTPLECRVFFASGEEALPNPVPLDRLDGALQRLERESGPHHALSLTGGEPLLFVEFLRPLAGMWKRRGIPVLLETGGHRPDELERMIDVVDFVMADVKLRSSAGLAPPEETVRRFLGIASRRECAVKIVVSGATTEAEVVRAAGMVRDAAPAAPIVLQPVSGARFGEPSGAHLLALARAALRVHRATRVIPQTHKILHVR